MSTPNKRREMDIMKLMMSDYQVKMEEDSLSAFFVTLKGPKDSLYEGGIWKLRVELPPNYPYKSPSVGFVTKIFHPNVDEASGSVCLDVINQTWSPMFDLLNIFEVFLPQLLLYPNAADPLNGEAASLYLKDPDQFKERVKVHIKQHATPSAIEQQEAMQEDDGELSSLESDGENDKMNNNNDNNNDDIDLLLD